MSFWAYVLQCSDGSYYVGHTDDLEARLGAHQSGSIPGYTQKRRPVELAWSQDFGTREDALSAERQIKGWSRAKKQALIRGDWDGVQVLSRKLFLRSPFDSPPEAATQDERNRSDSQVPISGRSAGGSCMSKHARKTSDPFVLSSGRSASEGRVSKDGRRA